MLQNGLTTCQKFYVHEVMNDQHDHMKSIVRRCCVATYFVCCHIATKKETSKMWLGHNHCNKKYGYATWTQPQNQKLCYCYCIVTIYRRC